MPRRSVQDNIRIKRERERATSVALAEYSASGSTSNLPPLPPPVVAPLKRKRARPTKAEKLAEAAALAPSSSPAIAANSFLAHPTVAPSYNHHISQASGSQSYRIPAPIPALSTHNTYPHHSQATYVPQAAHPAHPAHPALDPSHPFYAVLNAGQPAQPYAQPQHNNNVYTAPAAHPSLPLPKAKKARKTAAEKAAEAGIEHRPAKMRAKAPKTTLERKDRVMSHRMFMVDRERFRDGETPAERFAVLGSTGNVYRVTIDFQPSCDCPDCQKGNLPCKHIIFVYMKVLKLPASSTIWYQKGLTNSELKHVFAQAPPSPNDPALVSADVRKAYLKATGRAVPEDEAIEEPAAAAQEKPKRAVVGEDCPICYEEMSEADLRNKKLVFDESAGGCGNGLHRECFMMWAATARSKREAVTCVYCRAEWDDGTGAGGKKGKAAAAGPSFSGMGYLNMAGVAGISRERDTSSYYHGPIAGMRMYDMPKRYQND